MFPPALLRTFLAVAQTRSFTQAAQRLGVGQSTVSQHVRKLERATSRRLFARDTHTVTLTDDGEAMVGFARSILDANERALRHFAGSELRGRLRFGASEDLVISHLPRILAGFRRSHRLVDLELTVGMSGTLHQQLRDGELDLVFGKRLPGGTVGRLVRREPLVWVGPEGAGPEASGPVPLILHPPPSITRARAQDTLERHGIPWRVTCTSGSLSGLRAAALAGLGVTLQAQSLVAEGLVPIRDRARLPDPGTVEFVLMGGDGPANGPAAALSAAILEHGDRLGGPDGAESLAPEPPTSSTVDQPRG